VKPVISTFLQNCEQVITREISEDAPSTRSCTFIERRRIKHLPVMRGTQIVGIVAPRKSHHALGACPSISRILLAKDERVRF
jgi:hypothetical protein